MKKRIISLALILTMVIAMLSISKFGKDTSSNNKSLWEAGSTIDPVTKFV